MAPADAAWVRSALAAAFTLVHVLLSLAGIASGLVVLYGLLAGKRLDGWTVLFLILGARAPIRSRADLTAAGAPAPYRR